MRMTTPDDLVVTPMGLRFRNRRFPCVLGRGGVVISKREGDGGTPLGTHRIVGMLWRPDRLRRPAGWAMAVGPGDLWCDDPGSESYNLMVRAPFGGSAERLRRGDRLYDLVIVTDWNWPRAERAPVARGSAIFLHRWRAPGVPTQGCIGLAQDDLRWIAARIGFGTRLIVR
jgi:L,D-peptidoglycan transpeptidase YkuD (ErfK/YbiS/YcfS/YnhG family)